MCWTRPVNRGRVATEPQERSSCSKTALIVVVTLVALTAIVYGSIALYDPSVHIAGMQTWHDIALVLGGSLVLIAEGTVYSVYQRREAPQLIEPQKQINLQKPSFELAVVTNLDDYLPSEQSVYLEDVPLFLKTQLTTNGKHYMVIVKDSYLPVGDKDYEWCRVCFLGGNNAFHEVVFYKHKEDDDFTFLRSSYYKEVPEKVLNIIKDRPCLRQFVSMMQREGVLPYPSVLCKITKMTASSAPHPPKRIAANKPFALAKIGVGTIEECGPFCINFVDGHRVSESLAAIQACLTDNQMTITGEKGASREERSVWIKKEGVLHRVTFQLDQEGSSAAAFKLLYFPPAKDKIFKLSDDQIGVLTLDVFIEQQRNKGYILCKIQPHFYLQD